MKHASSTLSCKYCRSRNFASVGISFGDVNLIIVTKEEGRCRDDSDGRTRGTIGDAADEDVSYLGFTCRAASMSAINASLIPSSPGWSTSLTGAPPILTTSRCAQALTKFFSNESSLAVATEASSHPSGLGALYAQPWVYAGGGLGNIDECKLQTCLAGAGVRRDSLTFASVCVPFDCSAHDLAADDFVGTVQRVSANNHTADQALGQEYVTLLDRIAQLNKFLNTGWICGEFQVPWMWWPFGVPYIALAVAFICFAALGTLVWHMRREAMVLGKLTACANGHDEEESLLSNDNANQPTEATNETLTSRILECFDVTRHLKTLIRRPSPDTAMLDGLRAGSIFWIVLGHVMAIVSSSGAGYSNPVDFLPPDGLTTTVLGQLLFSARLAVDTFLIISGFLVVYVLDRRIPLASEANGNFVARYLRHLPKLVLARVVRILPLYAMTLGFYTQIAPHMGSGPFWYQWLTLLKPCADYGWTNFLFVNNFIPWDHAITETCFYHSWYLAVDMQLFVLCTLLVFWYQVNPRHGRRATLFLIALSVTVTTYLARARHWSINTFDGAAVARFGVEAYAKPHVRAQAYLTGMYVAMLLPRQLLQHRSPWRWYHHVIMVIALSAMAAVTFGPATGAYARRPCRYTEWPQKDDCGSTWSPTLTFWYTALSRTIWSSCVGMLMHLCLGRISTDNPVASILSWKIWVPLSQLAFGVYLIHPIVIFIWQLASREKQVFCLLTFGMNFISVTVVSYVAALCSALTVELPCAQLWKTLVDDKRSTRESRPVILGSAARATTIAPYDNVGSDGRLVQPSYGAVANGTIYVA